MNARFTLLFTGPAVAGLALLSLADTAVKGLVLFALAAAAALFMRRASAASRHLVWLCALAGGIMLPLAGWLLPHWRALPGWMNWQDAAPAVSRASAQQSPPVVPATLAPQPSPALPDTAHLEPPAFDAAASMPPPELNAAAIPANAASAPPAAPAPAAAAAASSAPSFDARWLLAAWAAGSLIVFLPVALSAVVLRRLRQRCREADGDVLAEEAARAQRDLGLRGKVRVLSGPPGTMPMVWGVFRHQLLLPADAASWPAQRLRAVLLHELAHLHRRDPLWQILAQCALALHWFNPLAWLAVRRLRAEQERACDDFVLRAGVRASDYAADMLAIAAALRPAPMSAAALSMARPAHIEGRITGILDPSRNRRALTRWLAVASALVAITVALPLAMLRAGEDDKPGAPSSAADTAASEGSSDAGSSNNSTSSAAKRVHQVQAGDTLFSIARRYGVPVASLKTWNHLSGDILTAGQLLNVSGSSDSVPAAPALPLGDIPPGLWKGAKENVQVSVTFPRPDESAVQWTVRIETAGRTSQIGATLTPVVSAGGDFLSLVQRLKDPDRGPNAEKRVEIGVVTRVAPDTLSLEIKSRPELSHYTAISGILLTADAEGAAHPALPKHDYARRLMVRWTRNARSDGSIPGALIGQLAVELDELLKLHPDTPEAPKLQALRPRLDASRDWPRAEAVALLDELTALSTAPVSWTDMKLEFAEMKYFKPGKPLPDDLKNAAWGAPEANGLRAACLFDPARDTYAAGDVVKSRILFHNAGGAPLNFSTETYHQFSGWKVRDAKGNEIKVNTTWYSGITPTVTYRLNPGDYCEVTGHGVAIGSGEYDEERSLGKVGAIIEAKAGDELTASWTIAADYDGWTRPEEPKDPAELRAYHIRQRTALEEPLPKSKEDRALVLRRLMLDLTGLPPTPGEINAFAEDESPEALTKVTDRILGRTDSAIWKGKLPTGEVKFKVIAADPDAKKLPGAASGPGRYALADRVHLLVSRTTTSDTGSKEAFTNRAVIAFLSPDPKVESPYKPYEVTLPDGLDSYALVWVRGSNELWLKEKDGLRKIDFSAPDAVKEEKLPLTSEAPPADVREALEKFPVTAAAAAPKERIPNNKIAVVVDGKPVLETELEEMIKQIAAEDSIPPAANAAGKTPEDQAAGSAYLKGFLAVRAADKLDAAGDSAGASEQYRTAKAEFEAVHSSFPAWHPGLVEFRLNQTADDMLRMKRLLDTEPKPRTPGGDAAGSGTDGAGEAFLRGHLILKEAMKLEERLDYAAAGEKYRIAIVAFESVRRKFPAWNPELVNYRCIKTAAYLKLVQHEEAKRLAGGGDGPGAGTADIGEAIKLRSITISDSEPDGIVSDPASQKAAAERGDSQRMARSEPSTLEVADAIREQTAQRMSTERRQKAESRQKAQNIRARLFKGEDFAELARAHSTDRKADEGGDWGWVTRREISREFAKVVFALPENQLSEVIETGGKYYIFRVDGRRAATAPPSTTAPSPPPPGHPSATPADPSSPPAADGVENTLLFDGEKLFLNGEEVSHEEIPGKLSALAKRTPQPSLKLQVAQHANFAGAIGLLQLAQDAGFPAQVFSLNEVETIDDVEVLGGGNNRYRFQSTEDLDRPGLEKALTGVTVARAQHGKRGIRIRADRDTPYDEVVQVLQAAAAAKMSVTVGAPLHGWQGREPAKMKPEFKAFCEAVAVSRGKPGAAPDTLIGWGDVRNDLQAGLLMPGKVKPEAALDARIVIRNLSTTGIRKFNVICSWNTLQLAARDAEDNDLPSEDWHMKLFGADAITPVVLGPGEWIEFAAPPVLFTRQPDQKPLYVRVPADRDRCKVRFKLGSVFKEMDGMENFETGNAEVVMWP